MGKVKTSSADKFILTEREFDYLRILSTMLVYNVGRDKIISGFLYYLANSRFGFAENVNLEFEIDLEDTKRELTIKEATT